jgi:hypothetical protein
MIEEKEELDVQEPRRLLGPDSYNDNWDLARYASELRDCKGNSLHLLTLMSMEKVK